MKILLLQFFFLISLFHTDYRDEFNFDYAWAVKFVKKHRKQIINKSYKYQTDTAVITSVVFPEVIRYSIFSNYFETKGLELIYVKYGKKYADFSIGYFQMKPSFVEKLEEYVKNSDVYNKKFRHITLYNSAKEKKIRAERLERLKSFDWQLDYLNCFYVITSNLHSQERWTNKTEKIKFYATAYNHGFYKNTNEIKEWINVALFPYGTQSKARQYIYSDISCYFFNNNYKNIFK